MGAVLGSGVFIAISVGKPAPRVSKAKLAGKTRNTAATASTMYTGSGERSCFAILAA